MKQLLEKLFKWGILGIFLLVPLVYIPWWVSPYVTSKLFFFMAVVDILVALWVWLMILDTRYRPTRKMLLWMLPAGLLLVMLTISSLRGVDVPMSFFSTVESGTGLIMLYHAFFFACMIASGVRVWGKSLVKRIGSMVFSSGVILAIATFFTSLTINLGIPMLNNSQGGAMMGNVLFLGSYLIFALFAGIGLFAFEPSRRKRVRYGIGLAVILLSPTFFISTDIWRGLIPFSQVFSSPIYLLGGARMATVSLLIGIAIAVCLWLILSYKSKISKGLGITGMIILLVGVVFGVQQALVSGSAINNYFVHESGNRLIDWREAAQGIKEKPVFGWGQENYRVVFQKYLDPHVFDPKQGGEVWTLHPHNNILEMMINGGVIALVLYGGVLALLVIMIIALCRRKIVGPQGAAIFSGMFVAYILQNQMVFDTVVSYVLFFSVIGVLVGLLEPSEDRAERNIIVSDKGYALGWLASTTSFVVLIIIVLIPISKVGALYAIARTTSEGRASRYYHIFNGPGSRVIQTGVPVFLDSFIRSYDSQKQAVISNPNQRTIALKEIEALLMALDPIWEKRTRDYHLSLSLAQLGNLSIILKDRPSQEDVVGVKKYTERALTLSPTDPQIYVTIAQTYAYLGNLGESKTMIDKALELNPNYSIAQRLKKILDQQ